MTHEPSMMNRSFQSYPPALQSWLQRMQQIIPDAFWPALEASLHQPQPVALRINSLRADPAVVLAALTQAGICLTPAPFSPLAFTVPCNQRAALLLSPEYQQQQIYLQSLSSQLPVCILQPEPHEMILDLTAAPGSKTSQMAALTQNNASIVAVEVVKARFFKLQSNLNALGVKNVRCLCADGSLLWRRYRNQFDRVLLDAPCSSEGRFSLLQPESFAYWSEKKIKEMTYKQWKLLCCAWDCLKPGGTLVYSTCTYAPEENEALIARLLKRAAGESEIQAIHCPVLGLQKGLLGWRGQNFHPDLEKTRRVLPLPPYSGFFIAKILKRKN